MVAEGDFGVLVALVMMRLLVPTGEEAEIGGGTTVPVVIGRVVTVVYGAIGMVTVPGEVTG